MWGFAKNIARFKDVNAWKEAELAAVWSLNRSLASESDFYGMCTAYANMLQVN